MSHFVRTDYTSPPPSSGIFADLPTDNANLHSRRTRRTPPPLHRSSHSAPPRRPSSAPPQLSSGPHTYFKFDPFADDVDDLASSVPPTHTVFYRTPLTTPASFSPPSPPKSRSSFTLHIPSQPYIQQQQSQQEQYQRIQQQQQIDRDARSRLVAGILLNRVYAVGKPMRRRNFDRPKVYVKSGLSSVVSVDP